MEEKATYKQIKYLKDLGYKGKTEDLNKMEAKKLIEEYLAKKENY